MSFFKLLEQFFYNQKIAVSAARNQDGMLGDVNCDCSLFRDCEFIFRFGPIKTTIKFEELDPYSLDMFHFGLAKGNISEDQIAERVSERMNELRSNLVETFSFIWAKLDKLFNFLQYGIEEIVRLS